MLGGISLKKYLTLRGSLIVLNVLVLFSVALIWPKLTNRPVPTPAASVTPEPTHTLNIITQPILASAPTLKPELPASITAPTTTDIPQVNAYAQSGFSPLILSIPDDGFFHLFLFDPFNLPYARLTSDAWDDIHPALSPDSTRLAYASRRNGYWDIYILSLQTGELTRLTDTLAYDGAPTWSPDGTWIAFETFQNGSLDIAILPVGDSAAGTIFLTDSPGAEFSPAWSPQGRQIAYISNQDGNSDLWEANLDAETNRLTNLTPASPAAESHPAWSPDGTRIAYSTREDGLPQLAVLDASNPAGSLRITGPGSWPAWSADGRWLAALVEEPCQSSLAAYDIKAGTLAFPPLTLPDGLEGIAWAGAGLPALNLTPSEPIRQYSQDASRDAGAGRVTVVQVDGVSAPQAYLNEKVLPAFSALRNRVAYESGWDFLATLENAYVPLTSALPPGMGSDWLYTGRALAFPSTSLGAGWTVLVREDVSGETYWRVFLKTRFQDGSQGRPLTQAAWDLNARYSGNPVTYDQGGQWSSEVPAGYWLDLTNLAARYGWKRLPALNTWRTFFAGTRFNELVFSTGLEWEAAMLEIYPPEALFTPTRAVTASRTPTRVPTWYKTRTPTLTAVPSITPSPRPTWTPYMLPTGVGG